MDRTRRRVLMTALVLLIATLARVPNLSAADPADSSANQAADAPAAKAPALPNENWPLFRGTTLAQGISATDLPVQPEVVWKRTFENESFESTPVIHNGVIYIGGLDGPIYALSLADGKTLWTFNTEAGVKAAPAYRDGKIYVGDLNGRSHCLDAATGKHVWGFETEAEIDSGANFFGDRVIVGSQDATLYCLEAATGKLVWKYQIKR